MRAALAYVLALALVVLAVSHVAIVATIARRRELTRAALALFVPPLAPIYAAERGLRTLVWAWTFAAIVYAVTLVFA